MYSEGREGSALEALRIGPRIALLRQERRVSRAALARAVGVTPGAVQGWESGKSPVKPVYWGPVARALGVTVQELTAEAHSPSPPPDAPPLASDRIAVRLVAELVTDLVALGVIAPAMLAEELRNVAAHLLESQAGGVPFDLVTQAEAARVVGVTRQALNLAVRSGRLNSYLIHEHSSRAPMVSLAEVRAVMGHHATREAAAPAGDSIADRAPEAIHPLKQHPEDTDTTPGGSTLPGDPTGPVPPPDGDIPDPPWLNEEAVRYDLIHYSAAASGEAFLDMPLSDQRALIEANMRALRERWRKWSPEQRAEAWAAYARERQEHPPRQG